MASAIAGVRQRIGDACRRAGRNPSDVTLVAVSKFQPDELVAAALACGLHDFAENEAAAILQRRAAPGLAAARWHLIGPAEAAEATRVSGALTCVHALTEPETATALAAGRTDPADPLGVFVQVAVDPGLEGVGLRPDVLGELVDVVAELPSLRLRGFMAMPPPVVQPEGSRPTFVALRSLAAEYGVAELSMGTSEDFEVAIEEGASIVRVGRQVFGARHAMVEGPRTGVQGSAARRGTRRSETTLGAHDHGGETPDRRRAAPGTGERRARRRLRPVRRRRRDGPSQSRRSCAGRRWRSQALTGGSHALMRRCIVDTNARTSTILDPDGTRREVLMFGSNDYLGLSHHPAVLERAQKALVEHGLGMPGSPLFNGYSALHRSLEERLADLKGDESALLFSSGYAANIGLLTALLSRHDVAVFDRGAHGSMWDGCRLTGASSRVFRHNDPTDLDEVLSEMTGTGPRCGRRRRRRVLDGWRHGTARPHRRGVSAPRAFLVVDDAHATGVVGPTGHGTAEAFGVQGGIDATIGTLGKALGAIGAWVSGEAALVDHLRCFAGATSSPRRCPPPSSAGPRRPRRARGRARAAQHLRSMVARRQRPPSHRPDLLNPTPRSSRCRCPTPSTYGPPSPGVEGCGIFLNLSVFPAVPRRQQRFRISVTADHRPEDIDRLVDAVSLVFQTCVPRDAA